MTKIHFADVLRCSQVVSTVQPSNAATNASRRKKHTLLMSYDREYVMVPIAMLVALSKGDFHREAGDIHNRWFEVLCQERVQYYDNRAKNISTMYFDHWEPLGVSESCRTRIAEWGYPRVDTTGRSGLQVYLGAPGSAGDKTGCADDKPGSTCEHRLQASER